MVTEPRLGGVKPRSSEATVDFPAPFTPTSAMLSAGEITRVASSRMGSSTMAPPVAKAPSTVWTNAPHRVELPRTAQKLASTA
jgi:hypothetical protein